MLAGEPLDFVHTGPGTLAGTYLRRFWQPVYRAEDLAPGRTKPIRIMGEDFTLYRGETGTPHVVAFRCAHRGAQLSTGWVEGDCIRCLYHGWRYEPTGQCVEQPGENTTFAAKIQTPAFPTREYLGLIFAYFGTDEPPELPRYPDFEAPGVLDVYPPEYWPCNYFNRIDNAADAAHLLFAHRESRRLIGVTRQMPRLAAEETPYGVRTSVASGGRLTVLHFHMPNVNEFFQAELKLRDPLHSSSSGVVGRLLFRVPVDDECCVSFPSDHVPLTGQEGADYLGRRRRAEVAQDEPGRSPVDLGERVLSGELTVSDVGRLDVESLKTLTSVEDYAVQVGQGAIWDRDRERLGRMDVGIIMIRKVWQRELLALSTGEPLRQWESGEILSTPPPTASASRGNRRAPRKPGLRAPKGLGRVTPRDAAGVARSGA